MSDTPIHNGYLVLADLSGFTRFVADAEVDHAGVILANLIGLLRARLVPILDLAEVEGDALFLYAPAERLHRGETLLELIESTYVAFRTRLRTMQHNATCPCQACRMLSTLDLKFVTHCGDFVLQDLSGRVKPFGSCVNVVHRLLKNDVTAETGWGAYALFTEHALRRMEIGSDAMHVQRVSYPHLGEFEIAALDLHRRHDELTAGRRDYLVSDDAHFTIERRLPAPAPLLWELMSDPNQRAIWEMNSDWSVISRPGGRTAPGAHNHCANSNFLEEVLDWRPFDYFTVLLKFGPVRMKVTGELREEDESNTYVRWSIAMVAGVPRPLRRPTCRFFAGSLARVPARFERLEALIRDGTFSLHNESGRPVGAPAS